MACDQYTLGAKPLSAASGEVNVLSLDATNALLIGIQPSLGCQGTIDILNPQLADTPFAGVVEPTYILTFADIVFSTAVVPGSGRVTLIIDGVNYGYWDIVDVGSGPVVTDNTTYGPSVSFAIVGTVKFIMDIGNPSMDLTLSSAVTQFDASAYIGCVIPVCGSSPVTPLPSLGASVKCANFSKIFNPLGIPLNRRK